MIIKFDILNHADFHGNFKEDENTPGLARFYSAIQRIRDKNPLGTLLLDAGDNTNKVLWEPSKVFEGLGLIGTDAFVLGNHEFDKGIDTLLKNISYANKYFPVLCANAYIKGTNDNIDGTKPYVLIEKQGIKIGVIGCTTEYAPKMVEKTAFEPFEIKSSVKEIRKYVPILRKQGAKIIIVLTHFPFYFEDGESGELFDILEGIKDLKIDAMIGGHIPGDYANVYEDIAVTKAGFAGVSLADIELFYDTELDKVIDKKCHIINVMDEKEYDERIYNFQLEVIEPYRDFYEKAIAYANEDIPMRLAYESPMGNLIMDAVRFKTKTDIAYFNATSCGRKIAKGDITRFTIHKAIAFNETLQIGTMSKSDIYNLFECVLTPERFGNNANIIFSGLEVEVKDNRIIRILKDGKELEDREYTVTTSKYMSGGGNDTYDAIKNIKWNDTGIHTHDAIAEYFDGKTFNSVIDNRYIIHGKLENDNSPW